jgi:hypothetical protein
VKKSQMSRGDEVLVIFLSGATAKPKEQVEKDLGAVPEVNIQNKDVTSTINTAITEQDFLIAINKYPKRHVEAHPRS